MLKKQLARGHEDDSFVARTDYMLRKREHGLLPLESAVEAFCEISAKFDVLLLILPDGYMGRAIAC